MRLTPTKYRKMHEHHINHLEKTNFMDYGILKTCLIRDVIDELRLLQDSTNIQLNY